MPVTCAASTRTCSSYLGAYTGCGGAARIVDGYQRNPGGNGPRSSAGWCPWRGKPFVVWVRTRKPTDERAAIMNPNYGYQLYQAERTQARAEVLAGDARRGRWA